MANRRPTRLERLKPSIVAAISNNYQSVLGLRDIRAIRWEFAPKKSEGEFLEFLLSESIVQRVTLQSPIYPEFVRYVVPSATSFEVSLSLRKFSYLSHASAVFLHGLTDQLPQRIYVNREQSPKPRTGGPILQSSIDKAFLMPQRETRYVFTGPDYQVVLLSGKQTARLEVGVLSGPQEEPLQVTKLERTLIDITVRPLYAGGVYQVLEAYRAAKSRVSGDLLLRTLAKLDYQYPYHQAIGFYMERAGYEESTLNLVERMGGKLNFYLSHGFRRSAYSERWRVFFPDGF